MWGSPPDLIPILPFGAVSATMHGFFPKIDIFCVDNTMLFFLFYVLIHIIYDMCIYICSQTDAKHGD